MGQESLQFHVDKLKYLIRVIIICIEGGFNIDDDVLKVYGYVLSSSYRTRAIKALEQENKTPTQIAKDSDIRINHVSKVLKELKECGAVDCLNEQNRKNRIYSLTPLGYEISSNL